MARVPIYRIIKRKKLRPFVKFAHDVHNVMGSLDLDTTSDAFKLDGLGISRDTLFGIMVQSGIIGENGFPLQEYISQGFFIMNAVSREDDTIYAETRVTGKGLLFLNGWVRGWLGLEG